MRTVVNVESVLTNVVLYAPGGGAMEPHEKLRKIREGLGLSLAQFAKELGYRNASGWQRYEQAGRKKPLPVDSAKKIVALVRGSGKSGQHTEAEIMALAGVDNLTNNVVSRDGFMQPLLGSAIAPTGDQDLPILGHVRGGEDAYFIDNGEIAGYTMRPNILKGVSGAYAAQIFDNSMYPAFKHGHLVWVHPRKPVRPGDDVVVQLNDGQALIKELVRRTDKEVVLKQHNPPKEIKLKRLDVKSIHLVVIAGRVPL